MGQRAARYIQTHHIYRTQQEDELEKAQDTARKGKRGGTELRTRMFELGKGFPPRPLLLRGWREQNPKMGKEDGGTRHLLRPQLKRVWYVTNLHLR